MALAHKGVEARLIPWRFSESEAIAFSNQRLVPILVHDGQVITDSWHIAQHIEGSYPDRPALFGDRCPVALAKFINSWADAALVSALVPIILLDIYTLLGGDDQDYFRLSREQRFGMTLEPFVADGPGHLARLEKTLAPLRKTLGDQDYFSGSDRSDDHTSELQSLMRNSYAVFC